MTLTTNRISETEIEVYGSLINGEDWILIRKPGRGTYARIAATDKDDDDLEIVIEEYDDQDHRALWDNLSDEKAADLARDEIPYE